MRIFLPHFDIAFAFQIRRQPKAPAQLHFYAGDSGKGILKIVISAIGIFLIFGGMMSSAAMAISGDMQSAESMVSAPLIGFLLLGIQSFYILYQIITVKEDSNGRPFC